MTDKLSAAEIDRLEEISNVFEDLRPKSSYLIFRAVRMLRAALADLDAAKAEAAHWKQQYAVVVRKLHEASDCLDTKDDEVERLREALENCHDLFWDNHCRAGVDIVHKALAAPQDGGNDER